MSKSELSDATALSLLIPAEIASESPEPVRSIAEQHVQYINGIGRLLNPDFRPIAVTDRLFGLSADGAVVHTVVALDSGEFRMKGGGMGVKIGDRVLSDSQEAAGAPFLKAASRSRRARDALILIGRDHPSWSELYLPFELVEAEVGGRMYTMGWAPEPQAVLFTRTANSYSTLGPRGTSR